MNRLLLVALAAALVAVPLATADSGQVQASSARYEGVANQRGDLVAFFLTDGSRADTVPTQLPTIDLRINTKLGEALLIETRSIRGDLDLGDLGAFGLPPISDPEYDTDAPPQRIVLDKSLQLTDQQLGLQIHVLPQVRGDSVSFSARSNGGLFEALDSLAMTAGRFGEPQPLDEDVRSPESPEFWPIRVESNVVSHRDEAQRVHIRFQGDFVVELKGATLQAAGAHGDALASGVWREPLHPAVSSEIAYKQRDVLARLFLSNATMDLDIDGGLPEILWAAAHVESEHEGPVLLQGARGQLEAKGKSQLLTGQSHGLPPGSILDMTPGSDALVLEVRDATKSASPQSQFIARAPATYAGIMAVVALLVAIGLGVMRRWGSSTFMHMELALEGGRFGQAARLAKRLLVWQPDSQSAMLGRAIALSKDGRAGAAIQELHAHLAERGASDGSLHYVLGTSYLDVGRVNEAREALEEAVRRTPALQADVDQLLGQPASATRTVEVSGYV